MTQEKIIGRIRKLLDMSCSDNPHEAALAAERAADLMAEHELTEAQVRIAEAVSSPAEPIVRGVPIEGAEARRAKKRVAWKGTIAGALARSMGCHWYWNGPRVQLFGRESAVQSVSYTYQYLTREINRLCEATWAREGVDAVVAGHSARAWKNSFRIGAASAIASHLYERETRAPRSASPRPARSAASSTPSTALALVQHEQDEVDAAYSSHSKNFGSARGIGVVRSRTGYSVGRAAGEKIHLGGGRAGLSAPPRQVRGDS